MDPVTLSLIAATAGGAATAALRLWVWDRAAERRTQEAARCDHVRQDAEVDARGLQAAVAEALHNHLRMPSWTTPDSEPGHSGRCG